MDYFLLKQLGTISIPREKEHNQEEPSIRIMENISSLERFDYLAEEALFSDRLKLLLKQYLIEKDWRPCTFVEPEKQEQKTFWFLPPLACSPDNVVFGSNSIPCSISINEEAFARKSSGIFYIPNQKGTPFVIVHISIAESILRRGFCGLGFNRLSTDT